VYAQQDLTKHAVKGSFIVLQSKQHSIDVLQKYSFDQGCINSETKILVKKWKFKHFFISPNFELPVFEIDSQNHQVSCLHNF